MAPNKEEGGVTTSIMKDLLDANFICEAKYTEWIPNITLVKKASKKWSISVEYIDLNRACPKDSYPLPNIKKYS